MRYHRDPLSVIALLAPSDRGSLSLAHHVRERKAASPLRLNCCRCASHRLSYRHTKTALPRTARTWLEQAARESSTTRLSSFASRLSSRCSIDRHLGPDPDASPETPHLVHARPTTSNVHSDHPSLTATTREGPEAIPRHPRKSQTENQRRTNATQRRQWCACVRYMTDAKAAVLYPYYVGCFTMGSYIEASVFGVGQRACRFTPAAQNMPLAARWPQPWPPEIEQPDSG